MSYWYSKFCNLRIHRYEWLINGLSTVHSVKRGLGLCALFWGGPSHMVLHIITLVGLALFIFSLFSFLWKEFCHVIWNHFPKSVLSYLCIKIVYKIILLYIKYIHMYNTQNDDKRRIVELELLCQHIITGSTVELAPWLKPCLSVKRSIEYVTSKDLIKLWISMCGVLDSVVHYDTK